MDKTQHFGSGGMLRDPRNTKLNPSPEKKLSPAFKAATAFALIAMVCIVIAFASPNWLEHDKRFTQYHLKNLGLWEVCFKGFRHPYQTLDKVYSGCWWVFSRYFDDLLDYIEKGFFITVQVFMSLGFLLFFIAMAMLIPVFLRLFDIDTEISVTFVMAGTMLLSCVCQFIGLVVFAVHGDRRDWLVDLQWANYGWSFYTAWLSVVGVGLAGYFYMREAVEVSGRRTKELFQKDNLGAAFTIETGDKGPLGPSGKIPYMSNAYNSSYGPHISKKSHHKT